MLAGEAGDLTLADKYLNEMIKEGCEANRITFNLLLNLCANRGEVERAEACLHHMVSCGLEPDQVSWGALCKAYARRGDVSAIQEVMQSLPSKGIPLNEYFYASLISACGISSPPQPLAAEQAFQASLDAGFCGSRLVKVLGRVVGGSRRAGVCAEHPRSPQGQPSGARGPHPGASRRGRGRAGSYKQ